MSTTEQSSLKIRPCVVRTYLLGVAKVAVLAAVLVGFVLLTVKAVGLSTLQAAADFTGVEIVVTQTMLLTGVVAVVSAFMVITIFEALQLSSHKWDLYASSLMFSPGKTGKRDTLSFMNITGVSFKQYMPLKMGELIIYVSGMEYTELRIKRIARVKEVSEQINSMLFDFRTKGAQRQPPPQQRPKQTQAQQQPSYPKQSSTPDTAYSQQPQHNPPTGQQ